MNWETSIQDFRSFLRIEKNLSHNSIDAYLSDIGKLKSFVEDIRPQPDLVLRSDIQDFVAGLNELGIEARSQARILSGIRAFYKYLLLEDKIEEDPAALIDLPKLPKKLPVVLGIDEIDLMIETIDMSRPEAYRLKAIIEVLYSCGLRVSELCTMKISGIYPKEMFIRVKGKGSKERLIPLSQTALDRLSDYYKYYRNHIDIQKGYEDFVFINKRGKNLSRVSIFTWIKELAGLAGITKEISPHTFRHSFASHLVDGGADLRAVQAMLGHESITTTEIYTHLDREYLYHTIVEYHPRSVKNMKK